MQSPLIQRFLLLLLFLIFSLYGCATHRLYRWSANSYKPNDYQQIQADTPNKFLKLHYADGSVVVYQQWKMGNQEVSGIASKYDLNRTAVYIDQQINSPFKDVSFIETNHPTEVKDPRVPIIVTAAVVTVVVGGICIADLTLGSGKACFGSCPTIYGNPEGTGPILAESFSDAISKSLENEDIDPLLGVKAKNQRIELAITNEAYESHLIKQMDLLAFDPKPGHEILHQGNQFFEVSHQGILGKCLHVEDQQDCTQALSQEDQIEALSKADAKDLGLKESYRLSFQFDSKQIKINESDRYALTLTIRNSLLNTFLFYQAWAWLGAKAGDWLMKLDLAKDPKEMFGKISHIFGDLQINARLNSQHQKGEWVNIGMYDEIGPIAQERVLYELPSSWFKGLTAQADEQWEVEIELFASRSNYRLDFAKLVKIEKNQQPRVIKLNALKNKDGSLHQEGTQQLLEGKKHFLIQPTEHLILSYLDPKAQSDSQYFLAATGYYLEWMHQGWLGKPDENQFIDLIANPEQKLKELAPVYKKIEPFIDQQFWNSRMKLKEKK